MELIKVDYTAPFGTATSGRIAGAINAEPYIHFGFGQREKTVAVNQEFYIYQDTLYDSTVYDIGTAPFSSTIISYNLNEFLLKYTSPGAYTVQLAIGTKDKSLTIQSNELKITVI